MLVSYHHPYLVMFAFPIRNFFSLFLLCAVALTSCDGGSSGQAKALRDEIEQLSKHHYEAQQAAKRLQSQLEAAKGETKKLEQAVKQAQDAHEEAKKELEQIKKDFETYKSKYKVSVRSQVPGLKLVDFAAQGKNYQNVVAMQFTDELLAFNHASGTGKLNVRDLPEMIRDFLGLTPVHQVVFQTAPSDARPVSKSKQLEAKRRQVDEEMANLDAKVRGIRDEVFVVNRQIGEAGMDISKAKYNKRDTYQLERAKSALELRKAQLESEILRHEVMRHEISLRRSQIQ